MQDNGYVAHANVKLMRALDSTLIYLLYVYGKVIKVRKENILYIVGPRNIKAIRVVYNRSSANAPCNVLSRPFVFVVNALSVSMSVYFFSSLARSASISAGSVLIMSPIFFAGEDSR